MKITPSQDIGGSYKTGTLRHTTKEMIVAVLGEPNIYDDLYKVRWSWGFIVEDEDGVEYQCAIWDWKGSADQNEWSTFGPIDIVHRALYLGGDDFRVSLT